MMDGKMHLILESFEYQAVWTKEDLQTTHYPSVIFPNKTDVEQALNRLITYDYLQIDSAGNYRKTQ